VTGLSAVCFPLRNYDVDERWAADCTIVDRRQSCPNELLKMYQGIEYKPSNKVKIVKVSKFTRIFVISLINVWWICSFLLFLSHFKIHNRSPDVLNLKKWLPWWKNLSKFVRNYPKYFRKLLKYTNSDSYR